MAVSIIAQENAFPCGGHRGDWGKYTMSSAELCDTLSHRIRNSIRLFHHLHMGNVFPCGAHLDDWGRNTMPSGELRNTFLHNTCSNSFRSLSISFLYGCWLSGLNIIAEMFFREFSRKNTFTYNSHCSLSFFV